MYNNPNNYNLNYLRGTSLIIRGYATLGKVRIYILWELLSFKQGISVPVKQKWRKL